ncbi:hypothetical protein FJY63_05400, partial [Candidatus Sumerlaeota bacterium]|nr:hypothetical protein [Candidatus Sumerlaeota bacterium]
QFKMGDIMDQDLSPATVVTLYLLDAVNLKLRPKLFRELRPGTRIVSHAFHMTEWQSDKSVEHPKARNDVIYLWIIPAPVGGVWEWETKTGDGEFMCQLAVKQQFQRIEGDLKAGQLGGSPITEASLNGRDIAFSAVIRNGGRTITATFKGTVDGDTISGAQFWKEGEQGYSQGWVAKRKPFDLAGAWDVKVSNSPEPLDGLLQLVRKDKLLRASYVASKDKKAVALPSFIQWGTSIYFGIDDDEQPIGFFGSLDGEAMSGKVSRDGWKKEPTWTAQRTR